MKYQNLKPDKFLIVLESGEEIHTSLGQFCLERQISFANYSAIGAIRDPQLSFYDLTKKAYSNLKHEGLYEICSLSGNVTLSESQPICHSHIVISDQNFKTIGGHLLSAKITVTCEIILNISNQKLIRKNNPNFNLKLLLGE